MTAITLGLLIALHGFAGQVAFSGVTVAGVSQGGPSVPAANLTSTADEVCVGIEGYDSTMGETVGYGYDCLFTGLTATEKRN